VNLPDRVSAEAGERGAGVSSGSGGEAVRKREYYELEAARNGWTGRELERQVDSMLFERVLLSQDRKSVMEMARRERLPERPAELKREIKAVEEQQADAEQESESEND
jgi:predicted nuclease of restriction endonuclease-like (RecB) superfamily